MLNSIIASLFSATIILFLVVFAIRFYMKRMIEDFYRKYRREPNSEEVTKMFDYILSNIFLPNKINYDN